MHRRLLIVLSVVMAMGVASGCVPQKKYDDLLLDLKQSKEQTSSANSQIGRKEAAIKEQQKTIAGLNDDIENLKLSVYNLEISEDQCRKNLADMETKHKVLRQENQFLQEELADKDSEIRKQQGIIKVQENVITEMNATKQRIELSLKEQLNAHQIKIEELEDKLKVTFVDKILFNSGSTRINPKGRELLLKLAETFREYPNQELMVEGHTDNVEIGPELARVYPSNWELSAARAAAVVRFLEEKGRVSPERLTACGHSFHMPVADNDTLEGRSQNRRIEIILTPKH